MGLCQSSNRGKKKSISKDRSRKRVPNLNDEEWLKIFSYLEDQEDKKSALMTCRRWFTLIRNDPKLSGFVKVYFNLQKFGEFSSQWANYRDTRIPDVNAFLNSWPALRKIQFSESYLAEPREFSHLREAMKEIDFDGSPNLEEVMVGTHIDVQDWVSLDSTCSERCDSNKGLIDVSNGIVTCSVTVVIPCAEQEWQIARTTTWPGSPAIKIFQVNFDPRVTRDPFHFDNVRHVSIGRIRNEDNLISDLHLFARKLKKLDLLVLDQVNCSNEVMERGLQPFIKAFSSSLKAVLVIYCLDKLENRCPLELITKNCPQLVQIYSLQTYYKAEAWILYGLDKTVQNEFLGQSGYLRARANVGLNSCDRHERNEICFQLLQQVDPQRVKFNTWMTRGDSRDWRRERYPIQFTLD